MNLTLKRTCLCLSLLACISATKAQVPKSFKNIPQDVALAKTQQNLYPLLAKKKILKQQDNPIETVTPVIKYQSPSVGGAILPELWANLAAASYFTDSNSPLGLYSFFPKSDLSLEKVMVDNILDANGGGAVVDDKLYAVNYAYGYGNNVIAYLYTYDTKSWTQTGIRELLSGTTLIAMETAVDNTTGTVYGEFYNEDASGYELGIVDYATKSRTTIGSLSHTYVALGYSSDDKCLYGIASDGVLYKIDATTAKETRVGSTGLTLQDSNGTVFGQTGEID